MIVAREMVLENTRDCLISREKCPKSTFDVLLDPTIAEPAVTNLKITSIVRLHWLAIISLRDAV